jgi:uncharacterized membrane protein YkvA (DUF1232 family)
VDVPRALLLGLGVVVIAWLVLAAVLWLHRPARDLAVPVLRLLPDIARLVRDLLRADTTPRATKVVLVVLLLYLLSPVDLVPEFVPVIGSLDDLIISAIVLRWAGRRVGPERLRDLWSGSPAGFELLRRFLGI